MSFKVGYVKITLRIIGVKENEERMWKRIWKKKTKLILSIVGLVVFAGVIFFGTLYFVDAKSKITTSAGSYNVEKIGELDVASIYYDKILNEEESHRVFGLTVGKERSLYVFHFKAQIFYDLAQATNTYDEENKILEITMPAPGVKLLMKDSDYSLDFEYYVAKNSVWIQDDNMKGLNIQKKVMENIEEEILGKEEFIEIAQENIGKILNAMYQTQGIEVNCVFLWGWLIGDYLK